MTCAPMPNCSQGVPEAEVPCLHMSRIERYITSLANDNVNPLMVPYPDLPSSPWFDPRQFPITKVLEEMHGRIRQEVLALNPGLFHRESEIIPREGRWNVLFLYERGKKHHDTCVRCPTITNIVEAHDALTTHAGLIYLSRMCPDTHIAAHRGPTNIRVRCHLGVQIPKGDCALRVDLLTKKWEEGKCLVFDDHYEHEAWNLTAEDRIVLIVDLWHPSLTAGERDALKGLHRFALRAADSMVSYWRSNSAQQALAMQNNY